jgi:hypothetical protein
VVVVFGLIACQCISHDMRGSSRSPFVEKGGAWKGIQSAAEACAKHLKDHIEGK